MAGPTEPDIESKDPGGEEEELRGQMSFFDHLEELRTRLINIVVVVGVAFAVCFTYMKNIFDYVRMPMDELGIKLVVTTPTDAFNLAMKVSFAASIFFSAPFIIREVWRFVGPALYSHERKYAVPFIFSASALFVIGTAFGYYIAFPFAVAFLIGFGMALDLQQVQIAQEYFDLFLIFELLLGVVFEIPAVIFVLSRLGLVTGPFLLRNFQYALLLSIILAAILTPTTDIPNMMMIAIPMVGLYSIGIVVAYIFGKKRD